MPRCPTARRAHIPRTQRRPEEELHVHPIHVGDRACRVDAVTLDAVVEIHACSCVEPERLRVQPSFPWPVWVARSPGPDPLPGPGTCLRKGSRGTREPGNPRTVDPGGRPGTPTMCVCTTIHSMLMHGCRACTAAGRGRGTLDIGHWQRPGLEAHDIEHHTPHLFTANLVFTSNKPGP